MPRPYGQGLRHIRTVPLASETAASPSLSQRFSHSATSVPQTKTVPITAICEYNSAIIYQHTIEVDPDKSTVFYVMVPMDFDISNDS